MIVKPCHTSTADQAYLELLSFQVPDSVGRQKECSNHVSTDFAEGKGFIPSRDTASKRAMDRFDTQLSLRILAGIRIIGPAVG
ncbi:hypothetical protein [Roseibium sediminis]|uniref:hypothetical protein n=1 Tax=Roseibium sediminis TaxID=1775174 RepID=UPI00123E32A4|nr:hypothetical protein [Roseibium sediminis]